MDIQEALKETGKAIKSDNHAKYATLIEDKDSHVSRKYLVWEGTEGEFVHYTDMIADDWQPYHEAKEIRPEKAGELWETPNGDKFFTIKINHTGFHFIDERGHCWDPSYIKSDWTRLNPKPEDDSVERIELGNIVCKEESECVYSVGTTFTAPQDLSNKPMKMILEYKKDD